MYSCTGICTYFHQGQWTYGFYVLQLVSTNWSGVYRSMQLYGRRPTCACKRRLTTSLCSCLLSVFDCTTAIFCPAMTTPANVTLSSDSVNVGVIVVAQCQPGTAFPDGDLFKVLKCVDNSSANGVSWNDSIADCQGRILWILLFHCIIRWRMLSRSISLLLRAL